VTLQEKERIVKLRQVIKLINRKNREIFNLRKIIKELIQNKTYLKKRQEKKGADSLDKLNIKRKCHL
jgi:hypothetical protein